MSSLHNTLFAIIVGAAALVPSACVPAAEVQVRTSVAPRLVMVDGIWLVENSPYATYYADGFYWQYSGGFWYRSPYYDSAFVRVDLNFVPRIVVGGYRHSHIRYRAPSHARYRPIDHAHRTPRGRPRR